MEVPVSPETKMSPSFDNVQEKPSSTYLLFINVRYLFFSVLRYFFCVYRLFSIISMIIYLLLGAYLFSKIERTSPTETKEWLNETRKWFLHRFRAEAKISLSQLASISREVENIILEYDVSILGRSKYEAYDEYGEPWSFGESFVFCFVVVTTIGYSKKAS